MPEPELLATRVVLVTGKGGVGKSTLAAALAVTGARTGRRACLVEVEGRQTMSRLFGTEPWGFDEREYRPGLFGMSIDPEASLAEYLEMFYGARRLSKLVVGSTAVEFATTAAPGLKDVLVIGKVKELERRREPDGRFSYDLVVVDAPPTGRIVNFLRAPDATTDLVNVGPIRTQAQSLVDMLLDETRTQVQLVTLLEEMPVAETIQGAAALHELGVSIGTVLVNRVLRGEFDEAAGKAFTDGLGDRDVVDALTTAGIAATEADAAALRRLGGEHLERLELEQRMREELARKVRAPLVELPYQHASTFGEAEIAKLADLLEESVA